MRTLFIICFAVLFFGANGLRAFGYDSSMGLTSEPFTEQYGVVEADEFDQSWIGSWSGPLDPYGGTVQIENYGFVIAGIPEGDDSLPDSIVGYGYTRGSLYVGLGEESLELAFAAVCDPSGTSPWFYGSAFAADNPQDFIGTIKFQVEESEEEGASMSGVVNVVMFEGEEILSKQITWAVELDDSTVYEWDDAPIVLLEDLSLSGSIESAELGFPEGLDVSTTLTQFYLDDESWEFGNQYESVTWGEVTLSGALGEGELWLFGAEAFPFEVGEEGPFDTSFDDYVVGMLTTSDATAPEAVLAGGFTWGDAEEEESYYIDYEGLAEHAIVPEPGTLTLLGLGGLMLLGLGVRRRKR